LGDMTCRENINFLSVALLIFQLGVLCMVRILAGTDS
jgi:hypothetical protein